MKLLLRILAITVLCVTLGVGVMLLSLYNDIRFEIDKIVYYQAPLTTQIYDRKGRLVANLFDKEFRFYAKIDEIPSRLIEALVAMEDTAFFEHPGINLDAIFRAMAKNIKMGKYVEGGSTLTQQLIKNVALSREKTILRKVKEALLSLRLETVLSKEEILERYLNHNYFGHGYYGIKAAARGYFKKELGALTLKEIAMLVSLPRAPSFYDPTRNMEFTLSRANKVLYRMRSLGWIEEGDLRISLGERPMVYDETLTQNRAPYVVDEVIKELSSKVENLKTGGYRIDLNIDLEYQEIARQALRHTYEGIKQRDEGNHTATLNGAMVVLDVESGGVLALIGGVDYRQSSFNRATQSQRQPGSSVKPFIYQTALDLGYSPLSKIADISRTYRYMQDEEEKLWQPKNYEKQYEGFITLKEALVHSVNLATINLVEEIGLQTIHDHLSTIGFQNLPFNLSISLGSFGVSPLQMSEYYTVLSNYGEKITPALVRSITNAAGEAISFEPKRVRITKPEQAYLMVDILKNVVNRGTGRKVHTDGIELAGKTGTTNQNVDAWFCGFSPTVQAVAWTGNDDNTPIGRYETGGRAAGPAVKYFFTELLARHPEIKRKFDVPEGVVTANVNGQKELFTEISRPPQEKPIQEDKLLF